MFYEDATMCYFIGFAVVAQFELFELESELEDVA